MSEISQVRRFNRAVSQRIGALNDRFLGRDRPLGESRLLHEIGEAGAEVRDLRARLELDSGYLSRLLRSLEGQGLIAAARGAGDGRVRRVRLTARGRAELKELDRRSDALARSLLDPLSAPQRAQLVAAMGEVERLLIAASLTIEAVTPAGAEAQFCVGEYFKELAARFEGGFDPGAGGPADAAQFAPPSGVFLVARALGKTIGCGSLRTWRAGVGEIKRVWTAPEARGLGIGQRILHALEGRARDMGFTAVRLDTNRALKEAQSLYRSSGYREISRYNDDPYAHHWFEKRLT